MIFECTVMNPAEIHRHICSAFDAFANAFGNRTVPGLMPMRWEQLIADLLNWLRGIDQALVFAGLLSILETEHQYLYQSVAGELLEKTGISSPIPIEEFLQRVLPLWNLSVGTVPRYAARSFGRETVLAFVHRLKTSNAIWANRGKLDAFTYHLGGQLAKAEPGE